MTKLIDAIRTKDATTENGMATNSTSLDLCVDLFFTIGAMRGQDKQRLINSFTKAYGENPLTATKLLFWARDVRGGAGERQIFRDIITYLACSKHKSVLKKNLALISEYGRWDDLLPLIGTSLEKDALNLIASALKDGNGLCAKWMPRPNVSSSEKKRWVSVLRKHMGLDPKSYRQMLVAHTNVVEQLMCSKEFGAIEYGKIPSKAMSDYMKAFGKNDYERFSAYLDSVDKGEAKINTGAVYPYDIVKNMKHGSANGADTQWNALPNYMEGNNERIIPLVDVSSSMNTPAGGSNNTTSAMDVAISLGLYISERNEGPFKDSFITFDSNPTLEVVNGTLSQRYKQMHDAKWGGSTNLQGAFELMLTKAKASNISEDEMPTMMIVLSDMEFNSAIRTGGWGGSHPAWNVTAQEMMETLYATAGYKMPKIVYWNIASRGDNNKPVQFDENGTALVSGFSPALLTSLLAGKDMTPYSMMMTVIGGERYAPIAI
jgi:hypothetical protein